MYSLLQGDCLDVLKTIQDGSINCCVTSPPYFGLRDYGVDGQIGKEQTPDDYVAKLVEVFREVRRVLCDDGTLWLNIGDSYAGSWGNYGGQNRGNGKQRVITRGSTTNRAYDGLERWRPPTSNKIEGVKSKDLIGVPWLLAFALRADGWYLRQDIIWSKPNPMPESVRDRCTKAHEYMFLLSKSERYYFDSQSINEPSVSNAIPGGRRRTGQNAFRGQGHFLKGDKDRAHREGRDMSGIGAGLTRNKRSVWTVPTKPYRGAHFATFPEGLVEPCVLAGCPEGGTVLDPFNGAGTTGVVSLKHGRRYVGIELNPEYIELSRTRIERAVAPLLRAAC